MLQSFISFANPSIVPEKSLTDTVDLGITYKNGEDIKPLRANFIVTNNDINELRIIDGAGTSAIFSIDGLDQTFRQFKDEFNAFPITVSNINPVNTVFVQYLFPQVSIDPNNKNQCKYIVGLINSDSKIVYQDTFYIIARKTNKYVGGYEEKINFDSVYIGNQFKISKKWYVRNVWNTPQRLFKDEFKLISSKLTDPEITLNRLTNDIILAPDRDAIDWEINYSPLDTKYDEAIYKLYYYPYESQGNTNDIDSVQTSITGVGVNQKLKVVKVLTGQSLTQTDDKINIDLGTMRPNDKQIISIIIDNIGNFPTGFKSEHIYNNRDDKIVINNGISQSKTLQPTLSDTINIEFTAGSGGDVNFKYEFESDLLDRKILGAQKINSLFDINFTGVVKQPRIVFNRDSVDFGAVTISNNGNCESSVTQQVVVRNVGNDNLEIYNILTDDNTNYIITFNKSLLLPLDTAIITITYEPKTSGINNAELLFISNKLEPQDTTYVNLLGRGVPQTEMKIQIDTVKSFPGTQILVPILVEKSKIVNANSYSDILKYNRTMLQFIEPIFANTATLATSLDTKFQLNSDGNLEINIKRQSEEDFLESDTLVILKFDTFLGNSEYSYIDFINTKIGNKNCEQLFDIIPKRGVYMTDSVCGLEFKAYDGDAKVNIISISPNPIINFSKVMIHTPVNMNLDIKLIDMLGEVKLQLENYNLKSGKNIINLNLENIPNGVYNILLYKNRFVTNRTIVINR